MRRVVSSTLLVAVCALIVVLAMANAGKGTAPRREVVMTQPVPAVPPGHTMEDIMEQAKLMGATLERHPLPPAPGLPSWACPGTEGVQNIHVRVGPAPDYFAEGKSLGMTDAQAHAHVAGMATAQRDLEQQMLKTLATVPPPPCP